MMIPFTGVSYRSVVIAGWPGGIWLGGVMMESDPATRTFKAFEKWPNVVSRVDNSFRVGA
jgi:hypothetical protein